VGEFISSIAVYWFSVSIVRYMDDILVRKRCCSPGEASAASGFRGIIYFPEFARCTCFSRVTL